jgi:mRNA interferase RelE/StbE
MNLYFTRSFEKDYSKLPEKIQNSIDKQLVLLLDNPYHPSLHSKKIKGTPNLWELRISKGYRLSYEMTDDSIIILRAGTHDMLKHRDF